MPNFQIQSHFVDIRVQKLVFPLKNCPGSLGRVLSCDLKCFGPNTAAS